MASLGSFGLDVGIYGPLADPQTILQLAQHAEEAGFESIWLADHVAFPVSFKSEYPYSAQGQLSRPASPIRSWSPLPPWACWSARPSACASARPR